MPTPAFMRDGLAVEVGTTEPLPARGRGFGGRIAFTRPADTTAYAALDVVGAASGSAILTLPNAGPAGGMVQIQSVSLWIGNTSVPSGASAGFRLQVFDTAPTAIADNAPFDLVAGDVAKHRGYVDIGGPIDMGSIIYSQSDYPGRAFRLTGTSLSLELQTLGGYTPASGTLYTLDVSLMEIGI